jgi:hypothetical protein
MKSPSFGGDAQPNSKVGDMSESLHSGLPLKPDSACWFSKEITFCPWFSWLFDGGEVRVGERMY